MDVKFILLYKIIGVVRPYNVILVKRIQSVSSYSKNTFYRSVGISPRVGRMPSAISQGREFCAGDLKAHSVGLRRVHT